MPISVRRDERTPLWALTPPPFLSTSTILTPPARASRAPADALEPALADRLHQAIRTLHYSRRTERAYAYWARRFAAHYEPRDVAGMGADEIRSFLSHLAVTERVSASTQNQALCALLFLYGRAFGVDIGPIGGIERAKAPKRLPVVLTRGEVKAVLEVMRGVPQLVCQLLYGAGLRIVECLSLRVKDLDFDRNEMTVRDGKGAKDRVTVLPTSCRQGLLAQLARVHRQHDEDLRRGLGRAPLPFALAQKYRNADREWRWQYVFPASSFYTDRHTGLQHRHHLHETVVQSAMAQAVRQVSLAKPATPHTLRHYAGSWIMPGGIADRLGMGGSLAA